VDAAIKWLINGNLPTFGELVAQNRLAQGAFFMQLGALFGRNIWMPP